MSDPTGQGERGMSGSMGEGGVLAGIRWRAGSYEWSLGRLFQRASGNGLFVSEASGFGIRASC